MKWPLRYDILKQSRMIQGREAGYCPECGESLNNQLKCGRCEMEKLYAQADNERKLRIEEL